MRIVLLYFNANNSSTNFFDYEEDMQTILLSKIFINILCIVNI